MKPKRLFLTILGILPVLFLLSGCVRVKYTHLPKPSEFKTYTKGMIAEVDLNVESTSPKGKASTVAFRGEMIAVEEDTLWILPLFLAYEEQDTSGLIAIPRDLVKEMDVFIATTSENPHSSDALTIANSLLPFTHGWWGIFTLPPNLVANLSIAGGARSKPYKMEYGRADLQWEHLFKFCRFPQGMPEGISRDAVQ